MKTTLYLSNFLRITWIKMHYKYFYWFILFGVISCDGFFTNENDIHPVEATFLENELLIRNGLNHDIYYFAVDEDIAAQILWVPFVTEQNRIIKNQAKKINLEDNTFLTKENPTIVYYWDEDIREVKSTLVE